MSIGEHAFPSLTPPTPVELDASKRSTDVEAINTLLRKKIIGQEQAIETLVDIYEEFTAGLNPPGRPVANVLFLGPTGTGKTRSIEALAEALYGDPRAMLKINCAEFQHSHEISKLIGSPPGYLGHRETTPQLSQSALNAWFTEKTRLSLLLFDEIEKASDALWQLLLGITDKASLTLGDGQKVDFSQCLIVMTSNLGVREMTDDGRRGFTKGTAGVVATAQRNEAAATKATAAKFSPEFLNRIDKTVVFNTLTRENINSILDIELGALQRRILLLPAAKSFVFSITEEARDVILKEGFDSTYNARHLKRTIESRLARPLARLVSSEQVKMGDLIRISFEEDQFKFVRVAEKAFATAMPYPIV